MYVGMTPDLYFEVANLSAWGISEKPLARSGHGGQRSEGLLAPRVRYDCSSTVLFASAAFIQRRSCGTRGGCPQKKLKSRISSAAACLSEQVAF
jgi:hypothetical protein